MNGPQKIVVIPGDITFLEEIVTAAAAAAAVTRVIATSSALPMLTDSVRSAHFYICRAELCEN